MTTITPLPTPPSRQDPLNFAVRGDEFLGALPQFATEMNLVAGEINTAASNAATSASNALTSANNAQAAAAAAQSNANYLGEWSTLSGPLTVPTSVSYNNRIYILTQNISDATAHTPGVSSVWLLQGVYENPINISTNTTAKAFDTYKVTANIVLTLPLNPVNGQWVKAIHDVGSSTFTIDRNGKSINGVADNLVCNIKNKTIVLLYISTLNSWYIMG